MRNDRKNKSKIFGRRYNFKKFHLKYKTSIRIDRTFMYLIYKIYLKLK